MKIKNFIINKYGPIADTGQLELQGFNLLYGSNENGKTLTIDALIKFLLGKKAKEFRQTGRVDGDPNGCVTLGIENPVTEKTLPEHGDIMTVSNSIGIELSSSDFKNIFIIRNSELSISNEAEFYTGITEKLVGLRTSDIKKIRKNLLELGCLTDKLNFKDDSESNKLKTRLNNAAALRNDIKTLREKLISEEYDTLELSASERKKDRDDALLRLKEQEDALNREKYEKCSGLMSDLKKRIQELESVAHINSGDLQIWMECEKDAQRIKKEILEEQKKRERLISEISGIEDNSEASRRTLSLMERKKGLLDDMRTRIGYLKEALINTKSSASLKNAVKRSSLLASIISIFLISFAVFFNAPAYILITGIVFTAAAAALWSAEIFIIIKNRKQEKEVESLRISLSEMGLSASSFEDMLSAIRTFNEDYENESKKTGELKAAAESLRKELGETENKISGLDETVDTTEKKIIAIKSKTGLKDIEEYRNAIQSKIEKEKQRDAIYSWLGGQLNVQSGGRNPDIGLLEKRIRELEQYREKGLGTKFSREEYLKLKEKKEKAEKELAALSEKIRVYGNEMREIERRANELTTQADERLYCSTMVDLEAITKWITAFIDEHVQNRETAVQALSILDELEKEEKERVIELFGKDAPVSVSKIFSDTTRGLYDEVIYNRESGTVTVKRPDGEIIEAEKLSGGAYDQLYLSVRLALGERLLKNEKGFFIMDDPFIKSDISRIEKQLAALKNIADRGWQILYFSAKKEIKDLLDTDIKKGKINYIEIKWLDRERTLF